MNQLWIFEPLMNDRKPEITHDKDNPLQALAAFTDRQPRDTNEIRLGRQFALFHGTVKPTNVSHLCLSMVKWSTISLQECKPNEANAPEYPKQNFALYGSGLLRVLTTTTCVTSQKAVECPVGSPEPARWQYILKQKHIRKRNTSICLTADEKTSTKTPVQRIISHKDGHSNFLLERRLRL